MVGEQAVATGRLADIHPVSGIIASLDTLIEFNGVRYDPDSDLPTLTDLYADAGAGLNAAFDRMRAYFETEDRDIPVALGAMSFPWLVSLVALGTWVTSRRLLDLSPTAVSYTFADYGYPQDIVLRSPRLWVLPGDALAGHPDVTVLADEAALVAELQRGLTMHLAETLTVLRGRGARVGLGTIRRTVAEAALSALCTVHNRVGDLDRLRADAATVFQTAPAGNVIRLAGPPPIRAFPTARETVAASVELSTCCLRFRLPGRGTCPSCPNQEPEERARRMAESVMLYG